MKKNDNLSVGYKRAKDSFLKKEHPSAVWERLNAKKSTLFQEYLIASAESEAFFENY